MVADSFSLGRKDIVVVSILSMLIPITYNLTKIALPLKLVDVGFSKGIIILPIMIGNFFQVFFRPLFGFMAEKYGHRKFIILAPTLYSLAFIIIAFSRSTYEISLGIILLGLAISMFWSSFLAYSSYIHPRDISISLGHVLAISYIGAMVGTIFSGYTFEYYGSKYVFYVSSVLGLLATMVAFFLTPVVGGGEVELKKVLEVINVNMTDIILNVNIISMLSIVNTYAPIILIESGISPTLTGILMLSLPLMSAVMQYLGGILYVKIIRYKTVINISALIMLIIFAFVPYIQNIFVSIAAFILYSILSSLLFTPQLSKSVDTSEEMRAVGTGGFGAGMALSRTVASTLSLIGGYVADIGLVGVSSPSLAIVVPSLSFIVISIIGSRRK